PRSAYRNGARNRLSFPSYPGLRAAYRGALSVPATGQTARSGFTERSAYAPRLRAQRSSGGLRGCGTGAGAGRVPQGWPHVGGTRPAAQRARDDARTAGPGAVAVGRGAADRRAAARAPHDPGINRFLADLPERSAAVAARAARDQEPPAGMAGAVGAACPLRLRQRSAAVFRSPHAARL